MTTNRNSSAHRKDTGEGKVITYEALDKNVRTSIRYRLICRTCNKEIENDRMLKNVAKLLLMPTIGKKGDNNDPFNGTSEDFSNKELSAL